MKKRMVIYRIILVILFCVTAIFYGHFLKLQKIYFIYYIQVYTLGTILYIILGMFMNSLGGKFRWRGKNCSRVRIAVAVLCVFVVYLPFLIWSFLPVQVINFSLGWLHIILALYAGANLNMAMFKEKPLESEIADNNG